MSTHHTALWAIAGFLQKLPRKIPLVLGAAAILAVSTTSFLALSQSTGLVIPPINLSADPLYAATTVDKPTMALALSVEFPTVGAQYRDTDYKPTKEYLGYYDAESCYAYNNNPTETPTAGKTTADYKRFDRSGPATARQCTDAFSGNFLNWASSSSIDMLRLALSGGDRVIDESGLTILQRAVLPDGDPSCFWNSGSNFPAKTLSKDGGGAGKYWGAVPNSMILQAGTQNITVANTLNQIYFKAGSDNGAGCTAAKRKDYKLGGVDGFFYSRVQVCNTNAADILEDKRDYGLCKQYPDGKYKPTGVIQKYADQIRLSAFGYLMDQTASYSNGRYGGVLRAPMKYVGQKTFDINGREEIGSNSKAEWDNNSGIFTKNPEGDLTFGVSGVINYLNQFGRTGPVLGKYKKFDTVGEMYYQSLRYLQGLAPTNDAIKDLGTLEKSNALYDGYPVYTDWTSLDPYGAGRSTTDNYACLKSNIVVVGDINTHDGSWRNTTKDLDKNVPDFKDSYNKLRGFEGSSNSNTSAPSNSQTSQIMGYAYWAHTNDIRGITWKDEPTKHRPGLRVKTFVFDVDEGGSSTSLATRSKNNQFFMAAKYGGFENDPSNPGGRPYNDLSGTPDPHKDKSGVIDSRVWKRDDGDASTYYLQSNARGVLNAFDEIFSRASTSARSIAASASQSSNQNASTANNLFSAQFNTSSWTGDVVAEPIKTDASKNITVSTAPDWSAAARLKIKANADRKIYVGHGGTTAATAFTWAATTGKSVQDALNKPSPSSAADGQGAARLEYLRGNRSEESQGGLFRTRTELLGDIINSGVTYSGVPSISYTGSGYAKFRTTNNGRVPAVFAGANDGMLHAFAAQSDASKGIVAGDELFAYIPSWMAPKLSALTNKDYINNHQAYVDAPSAVGEAQVASADADTDWKTILVSGTGAGGRGVFALDVSKPENFSASNALWEFTPSDDTDMGYVVSKPQIMKFKTDANTYRWFAVVSSGVNNYNSTFSSQGGSGLPALFFLALDKEATATWALGTNYFKVSLPVDTILAATQATGMTNFAGLYGANGEVTQIYAGDFHGQVWKLDFTDLSPSSTYGYKPTTSWNIGGLSSFNKGTKAAPEPYPFFIAKDATGNVQPITAAPGLFTGPIVKGVQSFYVVVGTGKYLETGDTLSSKQQSVYALYDNGSKKADFTPAAFGISGRGRLQAGTVDTSTLKITVPGFVWGRADKDSDATQRSGWYFDLPATGEKLIGTIGNQGNLMATFSTLIPGTSGAVAACTTDKGSTKRYIVSIGKGTGAYIVIPEIVPDPLYLINEDKTVVSKFDSTGRATRKITKDAITPGNPQGVPVVIDETIGRLSWRQIYNYQDLKNP